MTPKEKAEELVLKFMRLQEPNYNWFHSKLAKQCALITVDVMLEHVSMVGDDAAIKYWNEVKTEIEKL
jgi:nitrogenase molybdenum-iron protein alpha/beta subunit